MERETMASRKKADSRGNFKSSSFLMPLLAIIQEARLRENYKVVEDYGERIIAQIQFMAPCSIMTMADLLTNFKAKRLLIKKAFTPRS
jgi:hypothetical protein